MAEHNKTGQEGEELAVIFLQKKGYDILQRNYRYKRQEIDIIAKDGEIVVFVEVKTRNSTYLANPAFMISKPKQKRMALAANAYIQEHQLEMEGRFDVLVIILNKSGQEVQHIADAFYPIL